jgi:hypothetical protein
MRADILPGATLPDYELSDHTAKRRNLSELQGPVPMKPSKVAPSTTGRPTHR